MKDKLALKHARAQMRSAAADYGMQMRMSQMLERALQLDMRNPMVNPSTRPHTVRTARTEFKMPAAAAPSCAGASGLRLSPERSLSTSSNAGGGVSFAHSEEINEQIQQSVRATVHAMLPELAAAVASEVANKVALLPSRPRSRMVRAGVSAGADGDAPKAARQRSRPGRSRAAAGVANPAADAGSAAAAPMPEGAGTLSNHVLPVAPAVRVPSGAEADTLQAPPTASSPEDGLSA